MFDGPVVREFAVRLEGLDTDAVRRVIAACQEQGVNPGYALGRDYEEFDDGLLVALTEQRTEGRHRPPCRDAGCGRLSDDRR